MSESRWYYGELLSPCGPNASGMRWYCLFADAVYLKADTLDGLKALVRHERRRSGLTTR